MEIIKTSIEDVLILRPRVFSDDRGFFLETFQKERYRNAGIDYPFVQDNLSGSQRGSLRGLHYQIKQAQGKLIFAFQGEIFDVAVDLRQSSPTFGKHVSSILSVENRRQVWIPPGFAHGYYVLSEWAEVFYKATDFYAPEWERTLLWNDPQVGIEWPLTPGLEPIISEKDHRGNTLEEAETYK